MRRPHPELLAMLAVTAALAIGSGLLRSGCAVSGGWCPSDLWVMWWKRGLAVDLPPYQTPVPGTVSLEYPVLTGALMWLVALPSTSLIAFVWLSTVVLGLCALGITAAIYPVAGRRTWLWAAAPSLVWYLSFNYDAWPSLLAVGALALLAGRQPDTVSRNRIFAAAALLGLGGAAKLYPLLFVIPVVLWLLFDDPRSRLKLAMQTVAVAVGAFAVVNLPVLAANPAGWLEPYRFQAARPITGDTLSIWTVLWALPGPWPNLAATVATLIALIGIAAWSWQRGRRLRAYPLLPAAVALLAGYLLLNKVYSPQYALWLLPLLVLAGVETSTVLAYLVVDAVLFWSLQGTVIGTGSVNIASVIALLLAVAVRWCLTLLLARQAMAQEELPARA